MVIYKIIPDAARTAQVVQVTAALYVRHAVQSTSLGHESREELATGRLVVPRRLVPWPHDVPFELREVRTALC